MRSTLVIDAHPGLRRRDREANRALPGGIRNGYRDARRGGLPGGLLAAILGGGAPGEADPMNLVVLGPPGVSRASRCEEVGILHRVDGGGAPDEVNERLGAGRKELVT